MAWTAPATWSVAEVVTAAKMNLHVRDNLNYLRGLAGAVNIRASLAVTDVGADITPANLLHVHSTTTAAGKIKLSSSAPGFELQDSVTDAGRTMYGGLGFGTAAGHFGGGAGDMNFYTAANAGSQTNGVRFSTARDTSGNYSSRLFIPGGYAAGVGRVGINTDTPQGHIHVLGTGGGFMFLSANAVDGTLQTLAIAGTVTTFASFWLIGRNNTSGGLVPLSGNSIVLGGTFAIANGDTLTVTLTAGGAITIQRTAGAAATHQVEMLVLYK